MATYQDSRYNIALPTGAGGAIVPIKTLTASSSATLSFVDGSSDVVLDNTYRTYIFKFFNIHPATNQAHFTFNLSADTGSNYNVTKTTTFFLGTQNEAATSTSLEYNASFDIGQGTGFTDVQFDVGNDNDQSCAGELWLFNPSSTTYVKHFISRNHSYNASDYADDSFMAGYGNTTSAVDAVQFKFSSGNIDAGTIKLYGIA